MISSYYGPTYKRSFEDMRVRLEAEEEVVPGIPNPMAAVQQVMARIFEESDSSCGRPARNEFSSRVVRGHVSAHHRTRAQHESGPVRSARAQRRRTENHA
jgi:hypothetical protein